MHAGGIVTLTTDFGWRDSYVAQMKGTILSTALRVTIVDVTHAIPRHAVLHAAFVIDTVWQTYPDGTAHVAVVDPGVGTDRHPIALEVNNQYFIGPDNGLFSRVLDTAEREGHEWQGIVLTNRDYWRVRDISSTFHGRDIFAPVAAHLVNGTHLSHLGDRLTDPVRLIVPTYEQSDAGIMGEVAYVDSFGNCVTNIPATALPPPGSPGVSVTCSGVGPFPFAQTYGDAPEGEPLALIGSHDYLEIAVRRGNAGSALGIEAGTPVRVIIG